MLSRAKRICLEFRLRAPRLSALSPATRSIAQLLTSPNSKTSQKQKYSSTNWLTVDNLVKFLLLATVGAALRGRPSLNSSAEGRPRSAAPTVAKSAHAARQL